MLSMSGAQWLQKMMTGDGHGLDDGVDGLSSVVSSASRFSRILFELSGTVQKTVQHCQLLSPSSQSVYLNPSTPSITTIPLACCRFLTIIYVVVVPDAHYRQPGSKETGNEARNILRRILAPECATANDPANPTGSDNRCRRKGPSPLSNHVVRLIGHARWDIAIGTTSDEETL